MAENKQEICDNLACAIFKTRAGRSLIDIRYSSRPEYVTLCYRNGRDVRVNVSGDSGVQMMIDILRHV